MTLCRLLLGIVLVQATLLVGTLLWLWVCARRARRVASRDRVVADDHARLFGVERADDRAYWEAAREQAFQRQPLFSTPPHEPPTTACDDCDVVFPAEQAYTSQRTPGRLICEGCFTTAEARGRARMRA